MSMFFGIIGLIGMTVFGIMGIIGAVKKSDKTKKNFIITGVCFVLFVVGLSIPSPETTVETSTEPTEETETKVEEPKKEQLKCESSEVTELANKDEITCEEATVKVEENKIAAEEKAKQDEEKRKLEEEAKKKEEEAKAKLEAEAVKKKAESLKKTGKGNVATDALALEEGFVIFESTYQGGSNFIVELLDDSGNTVELITNTIGSYNGKSLALIPAAGEYILNVKSEGAWTVQASQDVPAESEKGSISGKGDDVRFVTIDEGLKRFNYDYKGESNFIVMANGSVLLVNEIGTTNGSVAQKVQDTSVYIISVKAEGNWKIDIE